MRVAWFPRALSDIRSIERYIEQASPAAARRVEQRIKAVVRLLGTHPRMGRPGRVAGTREFVVSGTPYIIAYAIVNDEVAILGIVHSSRRWPDSF